MSQKILKTGLDIERAKRTIDLLKVSGAPFDVCMTNYTISIKGMINISFIKEEKSLTFFNYCKKLKKEVSTFLEAHTIEPVIEKRYFDIMQHPNFIAPEVYNIDLSSAYLYVLKNNAIISDDLFLELNKLAKMDRLAVVGMLASSKSNYKFDSKGEIIECEIIEDAILRNVFFFCVNQTYLLMQGIKDILGNDYIFSWVDGVYFKHASNIEKVKAFLDAKHYPSTIDKLNNFEYYKNGNNIEIDFQKGKDTKTFSIPLTKTNFAESIYKYLQHKK